MEWINRDEKTPDSECKCLVFGSHGITTAYWKPNIKKFCDAESNDDEGMTGWDKEACRVTHWIPLPLPQPPEE